MDHDQYGTSEPVRANGRIPVVWTVQENTLGADTAEGFRKSH